jgi:hypothetical protein
MHNPVFQLKIGLFVLAALISIVPTIAFLRFYLLRGHWRAGWAGFIAARVHAFYAFLKYAKLHEARVRSAPGALRHPRQR